MFVNGKISERESYAVRAEREVRAQAKRENRNEEWVQRELEIRGLGQGDGI